ncbi:PepSY domain-containing protein, partial [Streptomyces sp. NPDC051940]|uniref:PepSY domain-containing protein n=1 Tax=Streptomyces sp. NPDC051940 TaxID=3155675 RepID=UPI0034403632
GPGGAARGGGGAARPPTRTARAPRAPRRRAGTLLTVGCAAFAVVFLGLYLSKGDSADYAHSSVHVDERLPYPQEVRRTLAAARVDAAAARDAAVRRHDGAVVGESLETDAGYARWNVDVLGEDGKVHTVAVDPGNGRILDDEVRLRNDLSDLRAAAASPTTASAVADMVVDSGRTPTQIVWDAGAGQWAATSWRDGMSLQQNYYAATGAVVPVAARS